MYVESYKVIPKRNDLGAYGYSKAQATMENKDKDAATKRPLVWDAVRYRHRNLSLGFRASLGFSSQSLQGGCKVGVLRYRQVK